PSPQALRQTPVSPSLDSQPRSPPSALFSCTSSASRRAKKTRLFLNACQAVCYLPSLSVVRSAVLRVRGKFPTAENGTNDRRAFLQRHSRRGISYAHLRRSSSCRRPISGNPMLFRHLPAYWPNATRLRSPCRLWIRGGCAGNLSPHRTTRHGHPL